MAKKQLKSAAKKARNLLHNHPLMTKGGVHEKSKKSLRQHDKVALKKTWFHPMAFA